MYSKTILMVTGLALAAVLVWPSAAAAECGDVNNDGQINILDIVFLINYKFKAGPEPQFMSQADVNSDGVVNVLDILRMINCYTYGTGPNFAELNCPDYVHTEINPGCSQVADKAFGYMTTEVIGNDLHIYHHGAFYQCCLEYYVDYLVGPDKIEARECDLGDLCDCYCDFELKSILEDLPLGEYTVVLIGIEGDTVGIDTVSVIIPPELTDYNHTGCLDMPKDDISYSYGAGILSMHHPDAFFFCSAEELGITVTFTMAGDTLRFLEKNNADYGTYCYCFYEINATVAPVLPGIYIAEVYKLDAYDLEPTLTDRRVIVLE